MIILGLKHHVYHRQNFTKVKFMIIPTWGKGNDSHFPKCSIIPKNHSLLFMFLPLNRKILTGLRHQWLIHKIKLLFLAGILLFQVEVWCSPSWFYVSKYCAHPKLSWISQYRSEERQICDCKFHSCLHFSFYWRCTSHCSHSSNLRHLNVKSQYFRPLCCVLINTDPSTIPFHTQFQVWVFPHFDIFSCSWGIYTQTLPPWFILLWLDCDFNIKNQTGDKSGLNRNYWLLLLFSTG